MDEKEVVDMEGMVQNHEKRIIELERNYSEVTKEINAVQASQSKIENMLYTQNTEQKELNEKHQEEQKELLDTLLNHTLGIREDGHKQRWQVIAASISSGGIISVVIYGILSYLSII